jgi:tetratricopeptide (TPR) repeat protein
MRSRHSALWLSLAAFAALAPPARAADDANTPAEAAKPDAAKPRPNLDTAEGRKQALDDLFGRLAKAGDDHEAAVVTAAIQRVWSKSGSDTADLLLQRARDAMKKKDWSLSEQVLDKVIEIQPDWAEAWNQRATARFSEDDYSGSIEDVAHVLALEPRHFGALAGLGFMFQKMEMKPQALRAFRKALDVNPKQDELRKIVDKLAPEVDGTDI